jgi:hypothetical protein
MVVSCRTVLGQMAQKRLQECIRRLGGKRLVVVDGHVITAYRASKATERCRQVRQSGDREFVA